MSALGRKRTFQHNGGQWRQSNVLPYLRFSKPPVIGPPSVVDIERAAFRQRFSLPAGIERAMLVSPPIHVRLSDRSVGLRIPSHPLSQPLLAPSSAAKPRGESPVSSWRSRPL